MATERIERRLTAILAADVAGYSRLTGVDEEGTHVRLKEHLRALVDPKITIYQGNTVVASNDNWEADPSASAIASTTARGYRGHLDLYLLPALGDIR